MLEFAQVIKKGLIKNLAKKEHHSLKQTKANFSLRGHITKVGEDKFFNLKPKGSDDGKGNKREKGYAGCKMSVKTALDNTVYNVEITGNEQDNVRYGWKTEEGPQNVAIDWVDRYNKEVIKQVIPNGVEANMYGAITIGLERDTYEDKETKELKEYTVKKPMTGYDAVYEIKKAVEEKRLTDETSVYISGRVRPNSWTKINDDGTKMHGKNIKLDANRLQLLANPVVFSEMTDEDKKTAAIFNMEVVVKEFNELNGQTYMTGIVVGYDFIEEMEFKFATEDLAKVFKTEFNKELKKGIYPKIRCEGNIALEAVEEEVEVPVDNKWGEKIVKTRKAPSKQVWVIVFADPNTIDTESYTEKSVEEAKEQLKAYKEDYNAGKDVRDEEVEEVPVNNWGKSVSKEEGMDDFEEDAEEWD